MKWTSCGLAALMAAAGCSRSIDTPEAVRQGVINDLSRRMDVHNMDVIVDSVSFRDHEADALISFAPKGAPRSQGMSMRYQLERSGNQWHIRSRSSGDLQRHEQQNGAAAHNGQLPAGHPAIGEGSNNGALPAGHPPLEPGPRP